MLAAMKFEVLSDDILSIIIEYLIEDHIKILLMINKKVNELVLNMVQRYLLHIKSKCYLLDANTDKTLTIKDYILFYIRFKRLKVLFIGGIHGYRRCDIYDSSRNLFNKSCGLHLKREDDFDAIYHLGLVFVFSGSDSASVGTVECYNAILNQWIHKISIPIDIVAISSASYLNSLFIFGGFNRSENCRSSNVYILNFEKPDHSSVPKIKINDINNFEWTLCEVSLLHRRSHHSSICYNNCIWIVGGFIDLQNYACNCVEIYYPDIKCFKIGPSLNHAKYYPRLLVLNNQLYCIGGDMDGTQSIMSTIEKYNEINNTWQIETKFPTKRNRCACFGIDNIIYLFGGSFNEYTQKTWDYYDIITKTWKSSYNCNIFMNEINQNMIKLDNFLGRNIGIQNTIAIPLQFINYS